ncbi:MAG: SDR family oxidoreductase [Tahibacter sp.]
MALQNVLITGAGSGLGRAIALRYARNGWRVGVADIVAERALAVVAEIRAAGGQADAFDVDIASDASVEALRDAVLAQFGHIDHLYNNAGVASAGDIIDTSLEDWRWMLDLNVMGVVRGCRAFLPSMVARRQGHIINTASFAGIACAGGLAAYSVAKAAVIALSESLRTEMAVADTQVGVSVACPSFFNTNLLQNFRGPEASRAVAGRLMQRAGETAADIADAIVDGVQSGRFMLIPTALERRRWRIKRFFPEVYFKKLVSTLRKGRLA